MKVNQSKEKPIFKQKGTLKPLDMICCCINSAIGLGSLKLGAIYNIGLLSTYALSLLIWFFTFYSLKLLVLSATFYEESTFEEIWRLAFSKVTMFIPGTVSILSSLVDMIGYVKSIQESVISILRKILILFSEEKMEISTEFENYKMIIGCFVFVLFLLPVCFTVSLNAMSVLSYISVCAIFLFTIYVIAMFFYLMKKNGFDVNHNFSLVNLKGNYAKSLSTLVFAFTFYPLTYPGIRHVKNSSRQNLTKIFFWSMIFIFFDYAIIGTFSYLSFFEKNNNGTILDYYPEDTETEKILSILGNILSLVYVLMTIPFRLNSCRYIILNAISNATMFPVDIWVFVGVIISLFALSLANLTDEIVDVLFVISDVMSSLLLFIFTPIYYLKAFKFSNKCNAFMSILLLIIGALTTAFMITYDGSF